MDSHVAPSSVFTTRKLTRQYVEPKAMQSLAEMDTRSVHQSQRNSLKRGMGSIDMTKSAVALNPRLLQNTSLPNLTTDAGSGGMVLKTARP